jgi:hypothetical protein
MRIAMSYIACLDAENELTYQRAKSAMDAWYAAAPQRKRRPAVISSKLITA